MHALPFVCVHFNCPFGPVKRPAPASAARAAVCPPKSRCPGQPPALANRPCHRPPCTSVRPSKLRPPVPLLLPWSPAWPQASPRSPPAPWPEGRGAHHRHAKKHSSLHLLKPPVLFCLRCTFGNKFPSSRVGKLPRSVLNLRPLKFTSNTTFAPESQASRTRNQPRPTRNEDPVPHPSAAPPRMGGKERASPRAFRAFASTANQPRQIRQPERSLIKILKNL